MRGPWLAARVHAGSHGAGAAVHPPSLTVAVSSLLAPRVHAGTPAATPCAPAPPRSSDTVTYTAAQALTVYGTITVSGAGSSGYQTGSGR